MTRCPICSTWVSPVTKRAVGVYHPPTHPCLHAPVEGPLQGPLNPDYWAGMGVESTARNLFAIYNPDYFVAPPEPPS